MQFCTGQDDEDTNCCFFEGNNSTQKQSYRHSRDICGWGSKHRNHEKTMHIPLKQTRLITKNHRKQKSQEKGKTSLSKLSARRGNYSKDHCQNKQVQLQVEKPHSSAPKSNIIHNQYVHPVNYSHQNSQVNKIHYKIQHSPHFQNSSSTVHNYQNIYSSQLRMPSQFLVHANYPQFESKPVSNTHFVVHQPHQFRILNERRNGDFFGNINQQQMTKNINQHQIRLHHLRNHGSQVSDTKSYMKMQANQHMFSSQNKNTMLMPTLETDRVMATSRQKSIASRLKYSSVHQPHQHPTTSLQHSPEIQFAESRYTDQGSPQLTRTHLKTVHSVFSQDANNRKQVNQSIILVDYFNPSESVRRQIQQKMNHRYLQNINTFGL